MRGLRANLQRGTICLVINWSQVNPAPCDARTVYVLLHVAYSNVVIKLNRFITGNDRTAEGAFSSQAVMETSGLNLNRVKPHTSGFFTTYPNTSVTSSSSSTSINLAYKSARHTLDYDLLGSISVHTVDSYLNTLDESLL